jgi:hypothetical protein
VQKQPGNRVNSLQVDVMAPGAIKSYNLAGAKVNGNNVVWSSTLETDKEFGINF